MNETINTEFNRLEKEMQDCKCGNGLNPILGDCHVCDVRYAKHEGMRFAIHQMLKEEVYWLDSLFQGLDKDEFPLFQEQIRKRVNELKKEISEVNLGGLVE